MASRALTVEVHNYLLELACVGFDVACSRLEHRAEFDIFTMSRRNIRSIFWTTAFRLSTRGSIACLRLKVNSCLVSAGLLQ